ncbi:MAG: hypothetical protein EBV77_02050 [Gemmatimonadaceae bacterium]|jgi:hypothetical protein|nr:hypothetical protein [Gemmatimonadaceae bacterium]
MKRILAISALSLTTAGALHAQPSTGGSRPAIRPLGAVASTSAEPLGVVNNIRALPGGKLLVNDMTGRRVLLMDSTFTVIKVVADTTPGNPNSYGGGVASLIAFRGDSTLFVDAQSLSMLVIDSNGEVARVMSVPRAQDAMMLAAGGIGAGAFYSNGHLVYRGMPNIRMTVVNGVPQMGAMPDTMPITRVNLQTRVVDTVGYVKIPTSLPNISRSDDGKMSVTIEVNPLPVVDEWAVTPNGDVAFVRGRDYHVDWVEANGAKRSGPKIAFDWKRLTDDDKVRLADSVKALLDKQAAANPGQGAAMATAFGNMMGGGAAAGAPRMQVMIRAEGGPPGAGGPTRAPQVSAPKINVVSPSQLPDYQPPFFATSTRADADGNLWVLTIPTKPQPAGSVYDVINGKGDVTERVLIPEGRTVLGFGPGGIVYLAKRITEGSTTTTTIERARAK